MNNGFTKTSVTIETLGGKLKKLRKSKNISLEDICLATKIQEKHLRWLEDDKYKKLPPQVYTEGFLKKYLKFLKESPEEMLRVYRKEQKIREKINGEEKSFNTIDPAKSTSIIISFKTFLIAIGALAVFGSCFYVYRQTCFTFTSPQITIVNPSQDTQVTDKTLEIIGKSSKGSQVSINGQLVYTDESGNFKEKITLQEGLNVLNVSAVNRIGKKIETIRNVVYKK